MIGPAENCAPDVPYVVHLAIAVVVDDDASRGQTGGIYAPILTQIFYRCAFVTH